MKKNQKIITTLLVGTMCMGLIACNNNNGVANTQPNQETTQATVENATVKSVSVKELEEAVAKALGDNYIPNMDVETLEIVGIEADLYDEFVYKMPMITGNSDTLIIVKAKEGKVAEVEEKMNKFRDDNVNNLMQYPSELTKTQCSQVVTIGNYVAYVQLGAGVGTDAVIAAGGSEMKEEDAVRIEMEAIEEQNKMAIDAMKSLLQ